VTWNRAVEAGAREQKHHHQEGEGEKLGRVGEDRVGVVAVAQHRLYRQRRPDRTEEPQEVEAEQGEDSANLAVGGSRGERLHEPGAAGADVAAALQQGAKVGARRRSLAARGGLG